MEWDGDDDRQKTQAPSGNKQDQSGNQQDQGDEGDPLPDRSAREIQTASLAMIFAR